MSKDYKLDIFELLSKLNKGNLHIWETLTLEQQKAFAPMVVTRWMSGYKDRWQNIMLDEFVNPYIWDLSKHPELLMKLLACCGTNNSGRAEWIALKSTKKSTLILELVMDYFSYTESEAYGIIDILTKDDYLEMAEELGYQKEDLTKLKKELGK